MKRMKRVLALVLVVVMCLSLSGCRWLEDMRSVHAIKQEDGTLLMGGYVYKQLPLTTEDLNTSSEWEEIYITKPGVPVLLSVVESEDFASGYCDNILIESYGYAEYDEFAGSAYYCRADYFESVLNRIYNGFTVDQYVYDYYGWWSVEEYVLTAEQRGAVDEILKNVIPYAEDDDLKELMPEGITIYLSGMSSDRLFSKDVCYIEKHAYGYTIYRDEIKEDDYLTYTYPVPEKYNNVFDQIFEKKLSEYTDEELDELNNVKPT